MAGEKLVRRALQAAREAAKPLPMDEASRMARAEALGFNPTTFYHGTNREFPAFDTRRAGEGATVGGGERAVFLVNRPAVADSYLGGQYVNRKNAAASGFSTADMGGNVGRYYTPGSQVMPLRVRDLDQFTDWDFGGGFYTPEEMAEVLRHAKKEGAPGAIIRNVRDPGFNTADNPVGNPRLPSAVLAVRDPSFIRSVFARFDPEKITSKDLLAGGAGVGAVGAAMEAGDMAQHGAEEPREGFQKGGVIARAIKAAREALSPEELLMGIHNTDAGRKLEMIEKLGGLPAPSIAVTKPSQGYTAFGDVSLVAPVEMVTPGRKTPAFGADVYSPRFPSVEDDQIFRGFTPSGKRRYAPVTMENVLREMKGPIRGGENWNYGPASVRAQVTPQFKSLAEMQAARDKIIPASDFEAQKEISNEMMERLRKRFEPYFKRTDPYRQSWSAFPEVLTDFARTGRPSEFAYDYKDLPAEALTEARSFLGHLRNMPTEYFEVKPQRAVPLSEFAGAVVPGDVPGEVVDRLRRLGLGRIEEYGDEASRRDALMKFVGEQGFADGGEVGGRLLEDKYPTHYLSNVGRQVMASGGSPSADDAYLDALLEASRPDADIRRYESRMADIARQPEDIRSMTHAPSKPLRPVEIEGGLIGKRTLGEVPYDVAGPLSSTAQLGYTLKTLPFYFTPAAPLAAAADFGEAAIDTAEAAKKGDYLGAGVTGALGVAMPGYAYRKQVGDVVGRALNAVRGNPGAVGAGVAGAAMVVPEDAEAGKLDAVRRGLQAVRGIRAYHGSPHDFERFDLSKIGTGEGAQAYGHGLYFAESEPVARGYRDKLTTDSLFTSTGDVFDPSSLKHMNMRVIARKNLENLEPTIEQGKLWLSKIDQRNPELASMLRSDIATLEQLAASGGVKRNPGRMYEVNIRANPDQFLDWDKPLREQSERVQNFFQARVNPNKGRAYSDDEFRSAFGNPLSGTLYESAASSRRFLEPILSGGQESADFVNLVAKSSPEAASALQAAIDKYARFNSPTGADVYQSVAHGDRSTLGFVPSFDRGVSASQELLEAGIPGIRYLDRGSRGAGEGSRNYVVFDDKLIDILRKYGIPIMASGAGAAAMGEGREQ